MLQGQTTIPATADRDARIDLLRFPGLALIIFAHVGPPRVLFHLRTFDVPMMVLVSGMAFSHAQTHSTYWQYIRKRLKRLVAPTWLFLTLFFIYQFLTKSPESTPESKIVISSYLLIDGIGYVWIIRVFLLVALASPLVQLIDQKTSDSGKYLTFVICAYVVYEFSRSYFTPYLPRIVDYYLSFVLYYMVPYALVFAIGLRIPRLHRTEFVAFILVLACSLCVFGGKLWNRAGAPVPPQHFKMPPTAYYLSYSLAIACVLWAVSRSACNLLDKIPGLNRLIAFVAANTIWIYLWHIVFVRVIRTHFSVAFAAVFLSSAATVFLQVLLVEKVLLPRIADQRFRSDLRRILTG